MVSGFVGGVRDAQGLRGYVEVPAGEVVAIDLARGVALWRREKIGRPVAATARRLMTLDRAGERLVLRLFEAASGADAGRIEDLGMPDWAGKAGLAPDAVEIAAAEVAGGVRLHWTLRLLYRGGAPPPVASAAPQQATGAVVVDPDTARVVPAAPAPSFAPTAVTVVREISPDPNVLAADRVGGVAFALEAKGAGVALLARDGGSGKVLWELPLAEQRSARPAPLRP